jgi:VWFA-related protein
MALRIRGTRTQRRASNILAMDRAIRVLLSALLAYPLFAQDPTTPDQTIKIDVELVNILCSVRTKSGGLVGNLEKDDFTVYENGQRQEIKYFARETDLPLTIGLLVDVSRSQERLIDVERDAAYRFFSEVLRPKDQAFLISFGEEAELLQDYTNSRKLLQKGLEQLRVSAPPPMIQPGPVPTVYNPKGTILFDATYLAAKEQLKNQVGRKVLILITDGVDQGSHYKLADAIKAAQMADAIIYAIYCSDPGAYGGFGGGGDGDLKRMAEETGGRVLKVSRKHTLQDVFKEIQDEMRSQYALGYSPTNAAKDGTFRRIEIKVRDRSMKVQARKGYYAVPADS